MAKATAAQHEASLAQDLYNLNNTRITSPVDGVVINRGVDVGQTVAASFQTPTLINIAGDLTKMQINASFAEADIGRLVPGLGAVFSVDAYPGLTFKGVLRQIRLNPTITSNVVGKECDVENPDQKLLPGMTAYVDIELYREDDVLLVPNTALNFRPTGVSAPVAMTATAAQASIPPSEAQKSDGSPPSEAGQSNGGPPSGLDIANDGPPRMSGHSEQDLMSAFNGPSQGAGTGKGGVPMAAEEETQAAEVESHGRVFKQGLDGRPFPVELILGATDLRSTVVKSGDLRPGDMVLIGENLPEADRTLMSGGMGGPMGGGRRR